jgi:bacterial/archaeal transporter family-2 protein
MNLLVLLATVGAGIGLSAGLAFNLKLAKALKTPLAASFVNFVLGASVLFLLWFFGLDGTRPTSFPPVWMLLGGLYGATYVTLSLITAARLGVGVSTVAVTLGQILGAIVITSAGWFGQISQRPSWTAILSAVLLIGGVALLAKDRERTKK